MKRCSLVGFRHRKYLVGFRQQNY